MILNGIAAQSRTINTAIHAHIAIEAPATLAFFSPEVQFNAGVVLPINLAEGQAYFSPASRAVNVIEKPQWSTMGVKIFCSPSGQQDTTTPSSCVTPRRVSFVWPLNGNPTCINSISKPPIPTIRFFIGRLPAIKKEE